MAARAVISLQFSNHRTSSTLDVNTPDARVTDDRLWCGLPGPYIQ